MTKAQSLTRRLSQKMYEVGRGAVLGVGEEVPNKVKPNIYSFGLVTVGENSYIPANVKVGKNTAISALRHRRIIGRHVGKRRNFD